jgi:hypothetical protein
MNYGDFELIERNIHQTAPSYKDLPAVYKENIDKLKKLNPKWNYFFYDDSSVHKFVKSNFDERTLLLFESIDEKYGAARADLFRYMVIYKYGGLYLDIKSTCIKPLDSVVYENDQIVTSKWPSSLDGLDISHWGKHKQLRSPEFQNWFILGESGNQILLRVINSVLFNLENYEALRDGVGRDGVLSMTGPIAYSKVLQEEGNLSNVRIASNEDLGFRYSIFGAHNSEHKSLQRSHYTKNFRPIVKTTLIMRICSSTYFFIVRVLTKLLVRDSRDA